MILKPENFSKQTKKESQSNRTANAELYGTAIVMKNESIYITHTHILIQINTRKIHSEILLHWNRNLSRTICFQSVGVFIKIVVLHDLLFVCSFLYLHFIPFNSNTYFIWFFFLIFGFDFSVSVCQQPDISYGNKQTNKNEML